jgi:hypothetical protein
MDLTMVNNENNEPTGSNLEQPTTPIQDDDITEVMSGRSNQIELVEDEICLRWVFEKCNATTSEKFIVQKHIECLKTMLDASEMDIIIIDNKQQQHDKTSLSDPKQPKKFTVKKLGNKDEKNPIHNLSSHYH